MNRQFGLVTTGWMIGFLAVAYLVFCPRNAHAQTGDLMEEPEMQQLLENLVEDTDSDFDFDTFLEQLIYFRDHPINLNRTDRDELIALGLLTDQQIFYLLRHIEVHGKLITIFELQAVPLFNLETIRKISPFVKVSGDIDDYNVPLKKRLTDGQHQLFVRYQQVLEDQKGFETPADPGASRYLGSPAKTYARYRYNFGSRASYGVTMEKDAGEEFFTGSQKSGFDYYSAHFFMRDLKLIKALAIGDYEVKLGQGLILWSGFGFRKSPYVMDIKKKENPLKPYTSVNENQFMRGVATTLGKKSVSFTAFASRKAIDANITQIDTLNEEVTTVSSFQQSGFHRTPTEINDKNAITETTTGGYFKIDKGNFHIGLTAVHNRLSASIIKNIRPDNQFDFSNDVLTSTGFDYSWIIQNLQFFGETAHSLDGGIASLNGLLMSLHPTLQISMLYRYFEKDYQSLKANAFAENTRPSNEQGMYTGLQWKPVRKWKLDAYFDTYRHPWLKFNIDAPSKGVEYFAQLTYKPNKKLECYARLKNEVKEKNTTTDDKAIDYLVDTRNTRLRYHIRYKVTPATTLKSRVELSRYEDGTNEPELGYLVYQDINIAPKSSRLSYASRFALFDIESYDARIYAYENDLLYLFSVPAYFNRGSRFYLMVKYKIKRGIDCWIRFAQTYHANKETIGSGLDEIQGQTKSDIKAQIRFKF